MTSTNPSSSPRKALLPFAAHALVLALLLGFWPTARAVYAPVFRAQADLLFAAGPPDALAVRAAVGTPPAYDTFVESFAGYAEVPQWRIELSALRMGYWPMAVLVALLLATPMTARRRLVAAGLGLLWLDAFAMGRVGLEVLRAFEELEIHGVTKATGGSLLLYRTLSEVSNSNIVVIAAVFLGWAATARPRENLVLGGFGRVIGLPTRRAG